MTIWVDADACPRVIKEILFRAAERTKTQIILVANQMLPTPGSQFIKKVQVMAGFDVADNYIIQNMQSGDLIITSDIPLADAVIAKEGIALNPRGERYSPNNIKQRLAMRNISEGLRNAGLKTSGPNIISKKEIQNFANELDKWLQMKTW